jgi:hypothetical protein
VGQLGRFRLILELWRKFVDKFWCLLEESVIVQSTVTLIAVGVTAYMVMMMHDVPKEWWTIMGIIIGFWFGSKVQIAEKSARRETAGQMAEMARVVKDGN